MRPRRNVRSAIDNSGALIRMPKGSGLVWAISFAIWAFVSLAATITIYGMYHLGNSRMRFNDVAGMELSLFLTYIPLTPFTFAFALRYPVQKHNWVRRSLLHLAAGLAFTVAHIGLKALTPYGYWDPVYREWGSAIWNSHLHQFRFSLDVFKRMFLLSVVDDIASAYVPIVIVAQAVSYYRSLRDRELRATQLESQLAKARLQTLKAQLQPHFLFNTMHSISALMFTDVQAADRMMARLSDLLRLSFEDPGAQMTTLGREIEFVNGYLEIEKTRFEDRLGISLDIAPHCLDAMVPHLLLQPLVENAVKHGVSRLSSRGEIHVAARCEAGDLHLQIRDNGPGLVADVDAIKTGVGLKVTRERLMTLYGEQARFELRDLAGNGAEVDLRIPFRIVRESSAAPAEDESAHNTIFRAS
jgi:two-component system, LytTR family, sensor kinase